MVYVKHGLNRFISLLPLYLCCNSKPGNKVSSQCFIREEIPEN